MNHNAVILYHPEYGYDYESISDNLYAPYEMLCEKAGISSHNGCQSTYKAGWRKVGIYFTQEEPKQLDCPSNTPL